VRGVLEAVCVKVRSGGAHLSRKSLACFRTRRLFAQSALVVRVRSMQKRSAGLMKGSQTSSLGSGKSAHESTSCSARAHAASAAGRGWGGGRQLGAAETGGAHEVGADPYSYLNELGLPAICP